STTAPPPPSSPLFPYTTLFRSLSLFIGGVTAVIMELAEPRVRAAVWEHTTFRLDPIRRLRRTGLTAMVTIYGARSTAEAMIARRSEEHTSELQSPYDLVCRLLL